MQYLLLIYQAEAAAQNRSEAENKAMVTEYGQFTQAIKYSGQYKGGNALQTVATATTVQVRGGYTLSTDGPFAETREQLGGYYLIDAAHLDDAIAVAARIPAARNGSYPSRFGRSGRCQRRRRLKPGASDPAYLAKMTESGAVERVFREDRDRILATLIGLLHYFDLAEEMMQEAFVAALDQWPRDGTPASPRAWIVSTARHKALDYIRRNARFREKLRRYAA